MKKLLINISFYIILISSVSSQVINEYNGKIVTNKIYSGHFILNRLHFQEVHIGHSAEDFQKTIYNNPFDKSKIGSLKEKDLIYVKEIMIIDNMQMWLKILYKDMDGYIIFNKYEGRSIYDFYEDGEWQPLNIIKTKNKIWNTLKCNQKFLVYSNLNIRAEPGEYSQKIGMITANLKDFISVTTLEVTAEYDNVDGIFDRWAKIKYNNLTGWVFAGYLQYERGGPRFITPEIEIGTSLGDGP